MSLPFVLLPYQQRWIADKAEVRVCEKSRRVGLSWAQAAESVLTAAAEHGMDTWYIGYNKEMAREFIRDCGDWARQFNIFASEVETPMLDDEDKDILAFRINFASGYCVTALSSRPNNLRGKQGLVVIDEAAFHPDLEGLLKAAFALLIWGGRVCVISTHDGADNPFNELIADVRAGKKPYSLHHITLDDALREGLYRRICLKTRKPWTQGGEDEWRDSLVKFYGSGADEELFCIPAQSGGAFLPRALIEARMDDRFPIVRLKLPDEFAQLGDVVRAEQVKSWLDQHVTSLLKALKPGLKGYFGMDFGRTGDLSVIAPLVEDVGLKRRVPFMIELRNVPFKQQEQILFHVVDGLPRFMCGALDARGNGQYLAEVAAQRYGFTRIAQVMLTPEWYREHMARYKAALEDEHLSLPKDGDVLDDHRAIQVVNGIPKVPDAGRTKGSDGGQRHGDSAIACVLAWHANGLDGTPIEFAVAAPRASTQAYNDFTGGFR